MTSAERHLLIFFPLMFKTIFVDKFMMSLVLRGIQGSTELWLFVHLATVLIRNLKLFLFLIAVIKSKSRLFQEAEIILINGLHLLLHFIFFKVETGFGNLGTFCDWPCCTWEYLNQAHKMMCKCLQHTIYCQLCWKTPVSFFCPWYWNELTVPERYLLFYPVYIWSCKEH